MYQQDVISMKAENKKLRDEFASYKTLTNQEIAYLKVMCDKQCKAHI